MFENIKGLFATDTTDVTDTDLFMTQNQESNSTSNIESIAQIVTFDTIDEQIAALRAFLKLPLQERKAILAEQAAAIAHLFVSGSEEMEWAEEYIEDENWDSE